MNALTEALNWSFMFISLSFTALFLRSLGRKLGEALKVKKYYLLYDVSIILFIISIIGILTTGSDSSPAVASRFLFLISAILVVCVTIRYWGWIVPEMLKAGK